MTLLQDPAKFLGDLLVERKLRNKSYSARAFARDLGLSQPFLSQILKRSRNLSLEQKIKLAARLGIPVDFGQSKAEDNPQYELLHYTHEHEKILKHWYHFAIFELVHIGNLNNDPKQIAKRLGISALEAQTAVDRLIEFGYLSVTANKKLKRTRNSFIIDIEKSSQAMRDLHQSRLYAAIDEVLQSQAEKTKNRFFQTLFLPTSRKKVKGAKKMIAEFQNKLIRYLTDDKPEEVFQLSLQIFTAEKEQKNRSNT